MATPITISQSALVTVEGRFDNQQIVNVFCYHRNGAVPSNADIDALALWWGNTGWPNMKAIMSQYYGLYLIKVKNVHAANGYEHDVTPTGTQIGSVLGECLPGQNSLAISWRTTVGGRSYRGRNFFGPLSEAHSNGNYASAAYLNLCATFAAFMISSHPGGVWSFAVGSRKLHLSTNISAAAIDNVIDSTDRRKPTRGS